MKKTYIEPAVTLTEVELQQILAGSGEPVDFYNNEINVQAGGATDEAMSRVNVWGEEEE